MRTFTQVSSSSAGQTDTAQAFEEVAAQTVRQRIRCLLGQMEKEYTTEQEGHNVCLGRGKRRWLHDVVTNLRQLDFIILRARRTACFSDVRKMRCNMVAQDRLSDAHFKTKNSQTLPKEIHFRTTLQRKKCRSSHSFLPISAQQLGK